MDTKTDNLWLMKGDCLDRMKEIPDGSVDLVLADPPYGLGFMGKKWDALPPGKEVFEECLRVLKPGGHLFAFGGTRTYHRLAVAVEDAGFEIRDMLEWIYASGFPKSQNVGKAYDKRGGKNLSWFIDYILKIADERGVSKKELTMLFPSKNGKPTGWLWNKQKTQGITLEQYHKIKDFLDLPFDNIDELEREVIGRGEAGLTKGTIANFSGETEFDLTKGNSQWEGYGTALKPAHEPIVMARKPLSEKTVVENCIKHGTGALDIDSCRIPTKKPRPARENNTSWGIDRIGQENKIRGNKAVGKTMKGRYPSNLLVTDDAFNDGKITKSTKAKKDKSASGGMWSKSTGIPAGPTYSDLGSKSRYFDIDVWAEKYGLIQCPKASKRERNEGCERLPEKDIGHNRFDKCSTCGGYIFQNQDRKSACKCENPIRENNKVKGNYHPTVKPLQILHWLIRLSSKEGDTVLDPFMGSGSTLVASRQLERKAIGIEIEEDYYEIAKKRLAKMIKLEKWFK